MDIQESSGWMVGWLVVGRSVSYLFVLSVAWSICIRKFVSFYFNIFLRMTLKLSTHNQKQAESHDNSWSARWLVGWLVFCSTKSIGQSISWLVDQSVGWLVDRYICQSIGLSVGWLLIWLVGRSVDLRFDLFP